LQLLNRLCIYGRSCSSSSWRSVWYSCSSYFALYWCCVNSRFCGCLDALLLLLLL
jgi:hypothetical protein